MEAENPESTDCARTKQQTKEVEPSLDHLQCKQSEPLGSQANSNAGDKICQKPRNSEKEHSAGPKKKKRKRRVNGSSTGRKCTNKIMKEHKNSARSHESADGQRASKGITPAICPKNDEKGLQTAKRKNDETIEQIAEANPFTESGSTNDDESVALPRNDPSSGDALQSGTQEDTDSTRAETGQCTHRTDNSILLRPKSRLVVMTPAAMEHEQISFPFRSRKTALRDQSLRQRILEITEIVRIDDSRRSSGQTTTEQEEQLPYEISCAQVGRPGVTRSTIHVPRKRDREIEAEERQNFQPSSDAQATPEGIEEIAFWYSNDDDGTGCNDGAEIESTQCTSASNSKTKAPNPKDYLRRFLTITASPTADILISLGRARR